MTHVITRTCCNDASCVPVCPVNCIHPAPGEPEYRTSEMLYIDPGSCIDCGACIEVCPVDAIVPDFDLQAADETFLALNAQWYLDPTHQDYPRAITPAPPETVTGGAGSGRLRVAVVGTGPAGCYVVEALTSQRGVDVQVNVFDRLPVPGGLLRYGVAPDHQQTKRISEHFARVLRHRAVTAYLGVEVGTDVSHENLLAHHHAVVYAVGAPEDKSLGIPGEDLPGSHSATDFVGWYNGHPDHTGHQFDLNAERSAIVGNGNVALDVARILSSDVDALRRTDIANHALEQLAESKIQEVVILGRRGPAQASFTTPELLGLLARSGVDILARAGDLTPDNATAEQFSDHAESMALYKAELLRTLPALGAPSRRRIEFRFLASPVGIVGTDKVSGIDLMHNRLTLVNGAIQAVPTGVLERLDTGLVFRSVGYRGCPVPGVPFDPRTALIPNQGGRVVEADLEMPNPHIGVYTAGWAKRGPSGVIGTNKLCADETVAKLLSDHANGLLNRKLADEATWDRLMAEAPTVDRAGWRAIEEYERTAARAESRPRIKVVDIELMRQIAAHGAPT